jgi:hypothetical protein
MLHHKKHDKSQQHSEFTLLDVISDDIQSAVDRFLAEFLLQFLGVRRVLRIYSVKIGRKNDKKERKKEGRKERKKEKKKKKKIRTLVHSKICSEQRIPSRIVLIDCETVSTFIVLRSGVGCAILPCCEKSHER